MGRETRESSATAANLDELNRFGVIYSLAVKNIDPDDSNAEVIFSVPDFNGFYSVRISLLDGRILSEGEDEVTIEDSKPSAYLFRDEYETGEGVIIETADGETIGVLKDDGEAKLTFAEFAPDESCVLYIMRDGNSEECGLYSFRINSKETKKLLAGRIGESEWSPDKRYLALIETDVPVAEKLSRNVRNRSGVLHIIDSANDYEVVFTGDEPMTDFQFCPQSRWVAFIEFAEDEFGDYEKQVLNTLDFENFEIKPLISSRRKPVHNWVADGHLAVTTFDKFAAPTINLITTSDWKATEFITTREFATLEPIAYIQDSEKLIYIACEHPSKDYGSEELWAKTKNSPPVRLLPVKGAE